jgi:ferredoxin
VSMRSAYNSPSKSPSHPEIITTAGSEAMNAQDGCPLFHLPPELRNAIYAYAIDRTDGRYGWIEDHDGPKISLLNARQCAPSNELLVTCRRICAEGRGIFVQAQRDFLSKTTFTLEVAREYEGQPSRAAAYLDNLTEEQISGMSRITIEVNKYTPLEVSLSAPDGSNGTPWAIDTKILDDRSRFKITNAYRAMGDRLCASYAPCMQCRCPVTYMKVWERLHLMLNITFRMTDEFHRAATSVCTECGDTMSVCPVVQRTRKMELMALVVFLCRFCRTG